MKTRHRTLLSAVALGTAALAGAAVRPATAPAEPSAPTTAVSVRSGASGEAVVQRPADAIRSTAADRESVMITVYNQNFGLVREVRDVAFTRGVAALEFSDVAEHIQPETVHLRAMNGGLAVLEQNYQYDLLDPQKLLEKYVGRMVKVWRWNGSTQRDEPVDAEVLSVNKGAILKIGDEITYNYPGRFSFPEIPDNLIARPTLVWMLDSERPRHRLEVSYLTNNMNWKADYVFVIDDADARGDLTGWVTLTNQSGASYENARLKLVAGDVQRMRQPRQVGIALDEVVVTGARAAPQFSEESFFEYHLYTLERPATLLEREQKQVTLLEADRIGLEKKMIFHGAAQYYRGQHGLIVSNKKVDVFLEFQNTRENGLGIPLPKGMVRVYKADRAGAQQFIGEDNIDHTPRDERIRIRMGNAFDVVGDRRQMEYRITGGRCEAESTWEVQLRNHKDEAVTVQVIEPIGGDWTILESSHPHRTIDAHTFAFDLDMPANRNDTIRYRVRVRWC